MLKNRAQFEILFFLEKNGNGVYSLREIADTILFPGNVVQEELTHLAEEGLLQMNEGVLSITESGLTALEPYRVKSALIMAAGFGSRMVPATLDRPKPLVKVNGRRIIDTLLDALVSKGIRDITVIRGYKKEKFDELLVKYPFLKFVDNDAYDKTNNISSMNRVIEQIDCCYICEADFYITNPDVITKYHYTSDYLGAAVLETDDWCYDLVNGHITNYRKGGRYCWNAYGISFWNEADSRQLRKDLAETYRQPEGKDIFWEFVPLVKNREQYKVEVHPCQKKDIMEIDNFYELVQLDPSYKDYDKR